MSRPSPSLSIRTKLILIVAGTVFLAITSAAYIIRDLVYQNIVDQKMTTVDILTASLLHDIKYGFEVLSSESLGQVIAKYMTYYRIIQHLSVYNPNLVNIGDSSPERKGEVTKDPDIMLAITTAKPSLKITDSEWDSFRIRSVSPILQGSRIIGAIAMDISIQDIQITIAAIERRILTILFITVLVASVILYILLRGSILRRLSRLVSLTHQVAKSNYDIQVSDRSSDEIGELASAFDQMTSDLRKSRQQIDNYNKHLEEMVREQTDQLHKAYEDLKNAQGQLVQNEKMASLGVLIAGIAHEINTPIGAIQNISNNLNTKILSLPKYLEAFKNSSGLSVGKFTTFLIELSQAACSLDQSFSYKEVKAIEAILESQGLENFRETASVLAKLRFKNQEKIIEYIDFLKDPDLFPLAESFGSIAQGTNVCQTSSQKIAEIVRALKYYAYADKDKVEKIQINESIQTALVLLRNRIKHNINVATDLDPDLPSIYCTSEIHQIWTNLLNNACDAIEGMGKDYRGEISLTTHRRDDVILLTVADNGIGIPESNIDKIFDPFFTTKDIGKGTGLGLSIVSGIIKKHNGKVQAKSRPGHTVFEITLPINAAPSGSSKQQDEKQNNQQVTELTGSCSKTPSIN